MADRGDTLYKLPSLNRWFLFSSVTLLVASVWMVLDDFYAPWKVYQREFREIEIDRGHDALETAEAQAALEAEEAALEVLEAAHERVEARRAELAEAEEVLRELKGVQFDATEEAKRVKQNYNWDRWEIEEHRLHDGDPTYGAEKLAEREEEMQRTAGLKEEADLAVRAQEQVIDALLADVTEAEKAVKASAKSIELTRTKLSKIDPDDVPTKLANLIRDDIPGLDFVGPTIQVKKVVLEDLTFELNFTKKKRIDMCMTCHNAIDREGFLPDPDDARMAHPHLSHPRLDLYLSAKSPHPMSSMGCTICHRGSGEALDFVRVDHRPSDEAEAKEWFDEYHWHKKHYWDYPMLSEGYVEASCVQCHKGSMELIADDAPTVTEGYRNFERYGCYACHKVEWFPTKRKPGPSLTGVRKKTTREFVESWVAAPRDFRPTTWMPQIFHLENYAPEDTVTVSEYGTGREIKGQEWNEAAVAAVSEYIWAGGDRVENDPIPVEGDVARGRETFRLVGCLSCHNAAPFTDEERAEADDPALQLRDSNEHGPNLRGIATKVEPEWLYAWIRDPQAYWSETRMPDLRLTEQEAADITAYMMEDPDGWFSDVPEGWAPERSPYDMDVLREQARWYYNRLSREELRGLFEDEWADDEELLRAVGAKLVENFGCHSCHEINGMEAAQPIGTELTNWGSKTVDKLDFGFMPDILAEKHGWSYHEKTEFKEYREGWLEQKLHAPRSYDRRKVKNPTEKLRMPWFDFDQETIQSIATFVVGLVDDEVQRAKMVPTPAQAQMDHGLRVIRQKNCASCHSIEPGTIEFDDEDGNPHAVRGQFLTLDGDIMPPPLGDEAFAAHVQGHEEYVRDVDEDEEYELEEVIVQLLEPSPGLGDTGTSVIVEDLDSLRSTPAWGGDFVDVVAGYYLQPPGYWDDDDEWVYETPDPDGEGGVGDVDGAYRNYEEEPYPKVRWTFAPPVLWNEGGKLQREWFFRFLNDPEPLREQLRVRMPTFNWGPGEAGAVADYFAHKSAEAWPRRFARKLLLELDLTAAEVAAETASMETGTLSTAQVEGIVQGKSVETKAGLPKLMAYALAKGFQMDGPVDPAYETIPQRTPAVLGPLLARRGDLFESVHNLAVNGPNCVQCHFLQGDPPNAEPIAWAPDLDHTRLRLRPDWVREWFWDPSKIYPGTSMPANFPPDESVYQDLFPGSSAEQIEALIVWLYNLDRASASN